MRTVSLSQLIHLGTIMLVRVKAKAMRDSQLVSVAMSDSFTAYQPERLRGHHHRPDVWSCRNVMLQKRKRYPTLKSQESSRCCLKRLMEDFEH